MPVLRAHMAEVHCTVEPGSVVPGKLDTVRLEGNIGSRSRIPDSLHLYSDVRRGRRQFCGHRVVGYGRDGLRKAGTDCKDCILPSSDTNFTYGEV